MTLMSGKNTTSPFGLRSRVIAVSGFPMVLVMTTLGFLIFYQFVSGAFEEKRERSTALLESFAVSSSIAVATQNLESLDSNMIRMAQAGGRLHGLVHVAMLDHRGRILAQAYARDEDGIIMAPTKEVPQISFYEEAIQSPDGLWKRIVISDDSPLLAMSIPAVSGLRWGTLVGYFELTSHEERIQTVGWSLIWITFAIALSMTLGLLFGLWRIVVRPVRAIAKGASAVRSGDLSTRIQMDRSDELGDLVSSFNDMTGELEEYTSRLQEKVEERTQELNAKNGELEQVNRRLEEVVQELDKLARTDRLTGISNRGHIMELLNRELRRSRRTGVTFSVMLIDIDHFKNFNDTYGHMTGDYVLTETVSRMKGCLRNTDALGRYGGEEFIAILPDTDKTGGIAVGENVRNRVSVSPYTDRDGCDVGVVTVSGGVSSFPEDGDTVAELIRKADQALYEAKSDGRNQIVPFHEEGR